MADDITTIDAIINDAMKGALTPQTFDAFCRALKTTLADLCNLAALTVARRFDCASMSYQDADAVMNALFNHMMRDASRQGEGFKLPQPAFSIYLAFDAGEYSHGEDKGDPVTYYTRPLVKKALGIE